jgi:hypothetical protein
MQYAESSLAVDDTIVPVVEHWHEIMVAPDD